MIYAIINIIITNARKSSQCSFYFTVWCKTLNEGSTRFIFYLQCGELEPCWSVLKAFFSSLSSLHITNKNGCVWIPLRICGLMGAYLVWSLRYDLLSFIWSDMRFLFIILYLTHFLHGFTNAKIATCTFLFILFFMSKRN